MNARWLVLGCSLAVFIGSLFFPGLLFEEHEPEFGAMLLAWGWWGLLTFDFPWFANPAYFVAITLFALKWDNLARLSAGGALAFGSLSLFVDKWWFNEGSSTPVAGLGPAFYIWMASFGVLLLGSLAVPTPPRKAT
jgi:hypothetical protein